MRTYHKGLHLFACVLALATFLLIVAGANVTSHRAGLSVPDWPTTYGQSMFTFPTSKWVGNIFYEHGHRLIASGVGFLTIVLTVWLVFVEERRWVRRLGIAALAAVIAQGVLGGLTVIFMLPPPISIAHATLAETFFCITVSLAIVTSKEWLEESSDPSARDGLLIRRFALATTVAVYCQIILGASIRHAELGVIAHIVGAAAVAACVTGTLFAVMFTVKERQFLRYATLLVCLVTAQVALGIATLFLRVPKAVDAEMSTAQVVLPTIHLALGALTLATSLAMTLKAFRFLPVCCEEHVVRFAAGAIS